MMCVCVHSLSFIWYLFPVTTSPKITACVAPHVRQVIVNIGCNSGQDSIAWLQRFDQNHFWNRRHVDRTAGEYEMV